MPRVYKLPELWIGGTIYPLTLKQSSQQRREAKRAIPNLGDSRTPPAGEGSQVQPSMVLCVPISEGRNQGIDDPVGINKLYLGPYS